MDSNPFWQNLAASSTNSADVYGQVEVCRCLRGRGRFLGFCPLGCSKRLVTSNDMDPEAHPWYSSQQTSTRHVLPLTRVFNFLTITGQARDTHVASSGRDNSISSSDSDHFLLWDPTYWDSVQTVQLLPVCELTLALTPNFYKIADYILQLFTSLFCHPRISLLLACVTQRSLSSLTSSSTFFMLSSACSC